MKKIVFRSNPDSFFSFSGAYFNTVEEIEMENISANAKLLPPTVRFP